MAVARLSWCLSRSPCTQCRNEGGAVNSISLRRWGSWPQFLSMRSGGVPEVGDGASAHRPAGDKASSASHLFPSLSEATTALYTNLAILVLLGQPAFLEIQQVRLRKGKKGTVQRKVLWYSSSGQRVTDGADIFVQMKWAPGKGVSSPARKARMGPLCPSECCTQPLHRHAHL